MAEGVQPAETREISGFVLPPAPLDAHAAFMNEGLARVKETLRDETIAALTIVLPPAASDHAGWRRALAGDLAREYTPCRVNIAAGLPGESLEKLLQYLRGARGVTGHYVEAYD